ncbi:hypothetical protein SKAU_G00421270 [Synaphobranchus kaupii]|uniref:Cathepsin propeptide inhibitor domain-containing protein n=1 Tax=Synaphobranchus kaupii TaxID=118154 RepID=A0A9Q1E6Q9_SYNKA|nr:hypothetical protein SKAU_G00421270 [Synaphobranchus kaupii]
MSRKDLLRDLQLYNNDDGNAEKDFQDWKKKFGKHYDSPEEEARRKKLWLATRVTITEHNKKYKEGLVMWVMGVNQFTDMDDDEYPCGCMNPHRGKNKH